MTQFFVLNPTDASDLKSDKFKSISDIHSELTMIYFVTETLRTSTVLGTIGSLCCSTFLSGTRTRYTVECPIIDYYLY